MSKKVKLADVLWDAANEHLSTGQSWYDGRSVFSCDAVAVALRVNLDSWTKFLRAHPAIHFLRSLGCKCGSGTLFDWVEEREERQGIRYMWLLLAMHCAEDEGVEIEVEA